jgi:hypothetical protein
MQGGGGRGDREGEGKRERRDTREQKKKQDFKVWWSVSHPVYLEEMGGRKKKREIPESKGFESVVVSHAI